MKGVPILKLSRYTGGNTKILALPEAQRTLILGDSRALWIDSSMEQMRKILLKKLRSLGNQNYYFRFRVNPLQILRHHKMASKGKVDRISMGMRLAFGSPFALAARVNVGTTVLEVWGRDVRTNEKVKLLLHHMMKHHAPFAYKFECSAGSEVSCTVVEFTEDVITSEVTRQE